MRTTLFVISDLHLGGAPSADQSPGFQICPPSTQAVMAKFIDNLPRGTAGSEVRLVLAGDIVDFLAEEPFQAFTADPKDARTKLAHILEATSVIWDALKRFVTDRAGAVTLMLGNHDIELSFPSSRRALFERIGPGRIDFIYDNEAFTCGPVLIEHGNRFDEWNAVPHGALRRLRSQQSRGLPVTGKFPTLPGSRLVVDVMNPLKKKYAFVDLLKPEDAGALPIMAALGAGGVRDVWQFYQRYRQAASTDYDEEREPLDEEFISASVAEEQQLFDLAEDIAQGGNAAEVGALGKMLTSEALFRALRASVAKHRAAFNVSFEEEKYLVPARRAAKAGFQVVLYGHTHLAKRVPLGAADAPLPIYLNTGTWADLMSMPESVWSADEPQSRRDLQSFVADLERNELERWRRGVPTFARIELEGETVTQADIYFADDNERVTTETLAKRLGGGFKHA
jgi:UDP-2,3-diacylglucosamine pyrophosphatase LpxH